VRYHAVGFVLWVIYAAAVLMAIPSLLLVLLAKEIEVRR
jgi:hypothetical protein